MQGVRITGVPLYTFHTLDLYSIHFRFSNIQFTLDLAIFNSNQVEVAVNAIKSIAHVKRMLGSQRFGQSK